MGWDGVGFKCSTQGIATQSPQRHRTTAAARPLSLQFGGIPMRIPRPGNREHARYKLFPSCGGRRPVAEKVGVVHPDVSSAGC